MRVFDPNEAFVLRITHLPMRVLCADCIEVYLPMRVLCADCIEVFVRRR